MYFASSVSLENADEYRHDVSPLLQSSGGSAPDPPALRPSQPPALCSGPEGRTRERKYKSAPPPVEQLCANGHTTYTFTPGNDG